MHPALAWNLRAIARIQRASDELRKPRLTEAGLASFERMRERRGQAGPRLTRADLIELLHQDLAASFPYPFDPARYELDLFEQRPDQLAAVGRGHRVPPLLQRLVRAGFLEPRSAANCLVMVCWPMRAIRASFQISGVVRAKTNLAVGVG